MSTPYDESFKALVRDDPLAFIHLMFPKAKLVRQLREKLKEWKLEVDALFEITLASLAFGRAKNEVDQEWLLRRYKQMFDLVKDTPVYREMMRDVREEGLKEGREEGLRQAAMDIIAERFPRMVRLATGILPTIDNSSVLRSLIVKMSTAQTATEAREHLLAVVEADEE